MQTSAKSLESYQGTRMKFSSQMAFLLTSLGFAAGFGSVWRFPYLVFKNGGGTFLIPYLILLFTLAIPIFYLEVALGQTKGLGLAHILQLESPRYRGFGYAGIIVCVFISTYYNTIMAYSLYYLWESFKYPVPWHEKIVQSGKPWSKEYFYEDILNISSGISDISIVFNYGRQYILVFVCILCDIIGNGVFVHQVLYSNHNREGVKTSGKVAYVTASSPYILLTILLIRGLFLEGAFNGIYYLFKPDLLKLLDPMVWVDAANQVIFQMSVGQAVLVMYGSYQKYNANVAKYSIMIPLLTFLCGMIAALVVFTYIGHISHQTGIPINDLPLSGPDLAFVLYPAILQGMPLPNLWCIMFFSVMVLLGVDTQFGFMDAIAGTLEDAHLGEIIIFGYQLTVQNTRLAICSIVAMAGLLYSTDIGFYLLHFVDQFATNIPFMISLAFELIYFCNPERFQILKQDLHIVNNRIPYFIEVCLTQVSLYLVYALGLFSLVSQIISTFHYNLLFALLGWLISATPFIFAGYIYKTHYNELPIMNDLEMKILD